MSVVKGQQPTSSTLWYVHSCDCIICSDLCYTHEECKMQRKITLCTKHVFSVLSVPHKKLIPHTHSSYCVYFDQYAQIVNGPAHDKTYNKICATSKDSDQPAHPRSLISLRRSHVPSTASTLFRGINGNPRHTMWMYRLVWVFAGHTGLIVGFWLIKLGVNDTWTLVGHFLSSLREKEDRDRRDSRGDELRDRGERKMNEREETEEIKTFSLYLYLLQG